MKIIKISKGTISQRKDLKWIGQAVITYEDGTKKRISVSGDDKFTCREKLELKKVNISSIQQLSEKKDEKQKQTYVDYLLATWINEKRAEGLSERTIENYQHGIKNHISFFANAFPEDITSQQIIAFQNYCTEIQGLSASTCNKLYNILNNSFNKLLRDEIIKKNPCNFVRRKYEAEKSREIFTKDEIERILYEAKIYDLPATKMKPNKIMYPFILFALKTGCRRGEICALKWEDVNIEKLTVSINKSVSCLIGKEYLSSTKNKQTREVPISEDLLNELLKLKKRFNSEYVFPDYRTPQYYASPRCIQNSFDAIRKKTNIKKTIHCFRHTFITNALESGISLKLVQQIVGHQNLSVTSQYWHPDVEKYDSIRNLFI